MRDVLSRRRIWTPHRYQFQTTECGVGVLAIVLAHYGRAVVMEDIRQVTGVSRDCLNAADIVAGAVAGQFVAAFALIWLALTAFQGPAALAAAALFAVGLGARNLLLARLRVRLAGDLPDVRDVQAVSARAIETTHPMGQAWDGPVLKAQDVSHVFSAR